jgi:hypothetical protein
MGTGRAFLGGGPEVHIFLGLVGRRDGGRREEINRQAKIGMDHWFCLKPSLKIIRNIGIRMNGRQFIIPRKIVNAQDYLFESLFKDHAHPIKGGRGRIQRRSDVHTDACIPVAIVIQDIPHLAPAPRDGPVVPVKGFRCP